MSGRTKILLFLTATAILAIAVAVYYQIDPAVSSRMPRCPMLALTGYRCPSCGIQRAVHQLLHGHFAEALRYNYFLVLAMPYAAAIIVTELGAHTDRFRATSTKVMRYIYHPKVLIAYVVLYMGWWVVRNLLDL